jgi:glycosyltransferase involved in cell wall biosynthesis
MKILNVIMSLNPVYGGGGVERTFQMSRSFVKNGMECTVLTTDIGLTKDRVKDLEGINVVALRCLNKRFYIPKFSVSQIRIIIENVDIIHLMGHWTILNSLVYLLARYLKKPYCICPAGSLPIFGRSRIIKRFYNWVIGRRIIRDASCHVAISENEIPHFMEYGVGVDSISIIPNGINIDDFLADDELDFKKKLDLEGTHFILFLGRLNAIKGPDLLLKAFHNIKNKLEDIHLVFVGPDDGMLSELKQIVSGYKLQDRVHFIGYLGGADKSNAYHAADLLVIPSRQEAMSIVALEAGISGTPVLLTDQCGFNVIEKIDGGKVVQATVKGIELGLIEILRDKDRLKSMGSNLKQYTYDNFTWDSVIGKYLTLFKQILDVTEPNNKLE